MNKYSRLTTYYTPSKGVVICSGKHKVRKLETDKKRRIYMCLRRLEFNISYKLLKELIKSEYGINVSVSRLIEYEVLKGSLKPEVIKAICELLDITSEEIEIQGVLK